MLLPDQGGPRADLPALAPDLRRAEQGVTGNFTCAEIDACLWGCGPKSTDQACWTACEQKGTATAQTEFKALDACWMVQGSGACTSACVVGSAFSCWVCLYQSCPTEFKACFKAAAGGTGSATCSQIFTCFKSCSPTDSLSLLKCVWSGTAAAQQQYAAVDKCQGVAIAGSCKTACKDTASTTCTTCLSNACSAPYAACK